MSHKSRGVISVAPLKIAVCHLFVRSPFRICLSKVVCTGSIGAYPGIHVAQSAVRAFPSGKRRAPARRVHLRAAFVATVLMSLLLIAGVCSSNWLERRYIHRLARESSILKDQGVVWQRAVFAEDDLLPVYGSSELLKHFGNEPQLFFGNYPSNFSVSPTGRAGCTSLIHLQKIAAAGVEARGRKLAICLSPIWFFRQRAPDRWYAGNFSLAQANQLIFSQRLSFALKQDVARRMLDYPGTAEKSPLLLFALHRLAVGGQWNRTLYRLVEPLGQLQNAANLAADHFEVSWHILHDGELAAAPARKPESINWPSVFAAAERQARAGGAGTPDRTARRFSSDQSFLDVVQNAEEWNDLELLLRVLRELGLQPLLVNIPMDSVYFRQMGVSQTSLNLYLWRLRELAGRYDTALVDFADHREDRWFLGDHHDHFSAKGWMFVNKELDGFFHAPAKHAHR